MRRSALHLPRSLLPGLLVESRNTSSRFSVMAGDRHNDWPENCGIFKLHHLASRRQALIRSLGFRCATLIESFSYLPVVGADGPDSVSCA